MTGDHRQNHLEIVLLQPIIESSRTTKFDFLSNHQVQTVQWRSFIESVTRSRNHNFKWNYVKWVQIQFSCYTNSKWTGSTVSLCPLSQWPIVTMGHNRIHVMLESKKRFDVFRLKSIFNNNRFVFGFCVFDCNVMKIESERFRNRFFRVRFFRFWHSVVSDRLLWLPYFEIAYSN